MYKNVFHLINNTLYRKYALKKSSIRKTTLLYRYINRKYLNLVHKHSKWDANIKMIANNN